MSEEETVAFPATLLWDAVHGLRCSLDNVPAAWALKPHLDRLLSNLSQAPYLPATAAQVRGILDVAERILGACDARGDAARLHLRAAHAELDLFEAAARLLSN
jgi:hypothetical protein